MRASLRFLPGTASLLRQVFKGAPVKASPQGRYIETAQYFTLPPGVAVRAEGEFLPPEGERPPYP